MSDLISKSEYGKALGFKIETIKAKIENCSNRIDTQNIINDWESEIKGLYDALILLNDAPTVDAVEVVRCKECKWADPCICVVCEEGKTVACGKFHMHTNKDGFCYYGERREVI